MAQLRSAAAGLAGVACSSTSPALDPVAAVELAAAHSYEQALPRWPVVAEVEGPLAAAAVPSPAPRTRLGRRTAPDRYFAGSAESPSLALAQSCTD